MTLDPFFVAAGVIGSAIITLLRAFVPMFGRWFDGLGDERKQAAVLWAFVFFTVARTFFVLYQTRTMLSFDVFVQTVFNFLTSTISSGGTFTMTRYLGKTSSA